MQIFDIGKDINQKCPRCKNSFDIQPAGKKGETKTEGTKDQPKAESAAVTEPPKDEPTKVAETTVSAPMEMMETPKNELSGVKEAAKGTDLPSEKKIMIKPPTPNAFKSTPAIDEKSVADKTETREQSVAGASDAAEKPAAGATSDDGEKPAPESVTPAGIVKKPTAAPKPTPTALPASAPRVEPPLAGFSKMQFMILFVLLLVAIIIQVVFAKKQMAQASIINDNLKFIHSKL